MQLQINNLSRRVSVLEQGVDSSAGEQSSGGSQPSAPAPIIYNTYVTSSGGGTTAGNFSGGGTGVGVRTLVELAMHLDPTAAPTPKS